MVAISHHPFDSEPTKVLIFRPLIGQGKLTAAGYRRSLVVWFEGMCKSGAPGVTTVLGVPDSHKVEDDHRTLLSVTPPPPFSLCYRLLSHPSRRYKRSYSNSQCTFIAHSYSPDCKTATVGSPYSNYFNIYTAANITATQFNSCNPGLNCSTLQIGKNVCVSAGTLPSNAPKPNPVCRCPHSQSRRRTKMVPLGWLMYDVHRCTRRFMHLQLFQTYPSIMEWLSQTQVGIPRWLGRKVAMYCGQGGGY
ncbi:hypothetical protein BDV98DRAFT_583240 [Pterulicium gracile]|uniref:LysM domain-containing protein n=1 Tax=Pterulicium gracile TaxID=1884261 RepID=A0A5C3QR00_9AGAR|nr:hypothetical protein BDV98DRAFT_583240 [Pterula gracilis]